MFKFYLFEFPKGQPSSPKAKTLCGYKTHKAASDDAWALVRTGKIKEGWNIGVSRLDGKAMRQGFIFPWLGAAHKPFAKKV